MNEKELVEFMNERVDHLLGLKDYYITIRRAKMYEKKESD